MNIFLKKNRFRKSGFTLIELLVVIAVIGLLATLAVVQFNTARNKAKALTFISDFKAMEKALILFKQSQSRAAWWSEAELMPAGPYNMQGVVDRFPDLQSYLPIAPTHDGGVHYQYDNDGDAYDPDGNRCGPWANGVGLYTNYTDADIKEQIDQIVDGGDGASCGKITYSATGVMYKLASDSNSASF